MKSFLNTVLTAGAILSLAFLAGCATTKPTVASHPDTGVSYQDYTTFSMMRTNTTTAAARNPAVTPFLLRQAREQASASFADRGLTPAPEGSSDLVVAVHGALENKMDFHDWGFTYGRFGRLGGRYQVDQYKEGTLFIDVFDAKSRELIWRGTAVAEVGDKPNAETLKATIREVVSRYPN